LKYQKTKALKSLDWPTIWTTSEHGGRISAHDKLCLCKWVCVCFSLCVCVCVKSMQKWDKLLSLIC